jgi:hypothetical protein
MCQILLTSLSSRTIIVEEWMKGSYILMLQGRRQIPCSNARSPMDDSIACVRIVGSLTGSPRFFRSGVALVSAALQSDVMAHGLLVQLGMHVPGTLRDGRCPCHDILHVCDADSSIQMRGEPWRRCLSLEGGM